MSQLLGATTIAIRLTTGGDGLQRCLDKAIDHAGEPPTCTKVNGTWVASWDDGGTAGGGIPGGFVLLMVLAAAIGIAIVIWRVSTARKLAQDAGLDPDRAGQLALLDDDGLSATYLASSLRGPARAGAEPGPDSGSPSPATRSTSERLRELQTLLENGEITQAEHDQRRRAVIDSV